jgi:hypothetical protein
VDAEGGAETFAWSAVGGEEGPPIGVATGADAPDDLAGAEVLSDPVAVDELLDEEAAGGAGGVKSAVSPEAGSGCLAVLAFFRKAAKVLLPSSGALMAKTIPLLQWLP